MALAACDKVGSHFLIRARTNLRAQGIKRFKDGSRLVRLPVRQKGKPRRITQWIEVREIRVRVQRPGGAVEEIGCGALILACNGFGGDAAPEQAPEDAPVEG